MPSITSKLLFGGSDIPTVNGYRTFASHQRGDRASRTCRQHRVRTPRHIQISCCLVGFRSLSNAIDHCARHATPAASRVICKSRPKIAAACVSLPHTPDANTGKEYQSKAARDEGVDRCHLPRRSVGRPPTRRGRNRRVTASCSDRWMIDPRCVST